MFETTLLILGLIFPTLSLLSFIATLVTRWRHDRHTSPVFIPFFGPVLLTCWVLVAGHPRWLIPVIWLLDLGTGAFFFVLPQLVAEWWQHSAFTRLITLHGAHGIEKVILTLHRGGRYFARKSWNRAPGELGIISLGEAGTFIDDGEVIALLSDLGLNRQLNRIDLNTYDVSEPNDSGPELRNYSLHGWRLCCSTTASQSESRSRRSRRLGIW